jgi:hypothetical protein
VTAPTEGVGPAARLASVRAPTSCSIRKHCLTLPPSAGISSRLVKPAHTHWCDGPGGGNPASATTEISGPDCGTFVMPDFGCDARQSVERIWECLPRLGAPASGWTRGPVLVGAAEPGAHNRGNWQLSLSPSALAGPWQPLLATQVSIRGTCTCQTIVIRALEKAAAAIALRRRSSSAFRACAGFQRVLSG